MKIKDLKNKKILILGYGQEGLDSLKFIKKIFPEKTVGIADKNIKIKNNLKKINYHLGENYLDSIKKYDVIIKSPGIPVHLVEKLITKKQILTSCSDLFLNNVQGIVIGITGTKGKSSTSNLIYKILKSNNFNSFLIGNIGSPSLSHLLKDKKENVYVYEFSSFQLDGITKSPNIAVILNIYRDHLDHHLDFQEYMDAKKRIIDFQKKDDFVFYNEKDALVKKIVKNSKSEKIPFNPEKDYFDLVKKVSKLFKVPDKIINKEIKKIESLPHRIELIGKKNKIIFYNDSSATIPEATIVAIKKLKKVNTLIVGGVNKGFNYNRLVQEIISCKVENVIYFPETGIEIAKKLRKKDKKINLFPAFSMKEAVLIAAKKTKKEKICLLSPASSSFNMFKNYKERGDLFKKYVKKI
jgi:UDP-N-acetylmuramoyl-L-alanine---L-glutamate ligase